MISSSYCFICCAICCKHITFKPDSGITCADLPFVACGPQPHDKTPKQAWAERHLHTSIAARLHNLAATPLVVMTGWAA